MSTTQLHHDIYSHFIDIMYEYKCSTNIIQLVSAVSDVITATDISIGAVARFRAPDNTIVAIAVFTTHNFYPTPSLIHNIHHTMYLMYYSIL